VLIDTQLILGNGKKSVALDDYILGATTLYVDIVQLFIRILRILGKKKDE
jgi:FtsH-binding integral membrane protein